MGIYPPIPSYPYLSMSPSILIPSHLLSYLFYLSYPHPYLYPSPLPYLSPLPHPIHLIRSIYCMSSCHVNVSVSYCHTNMSLCHTSITILIRLHMDNIYVNKLTMKQLTINICKLIHSCEHCTSAEYYITNIINKTNYILLQTKYEQYWII